MSYITVTSALAARPGPIVLKVEAIHAILNKDGHSLVVLGEVNGGFHCAESPSEVLGLMEAAIAAEDSLGDAADVVYDWENSR